jgi:hypothetical protein
MHVGMHTTTRWLFKCSQPDVVVVDAACISYPVVLVRLVAADTEGLFGRVYIHLNLYVLKLIEEELN